MAFASVDSLRDYLPQIAEDGQQLITIGGSPSGGTFLLGYEGTNTSALAYNATATTVQTALRAIPAITSSGVNVRGRPGGPYTATFQGVLATDAAPLTASGALLTPAGTVQVQPASDTLLSQALDRATDIVRGAMRSLLADPTFDYTGWNVASTTIVRGYDGYYLHLPPYRAGTVTLVESQSGSSPSAYTTLSSDIWEATSSGSLYRASGWGGAMWGELPRYRVTAVWGYGPTPPDAIVQLTLELAVNIYRTRDKGGFTDTIGVDGQGATRFVSGLTNLQRQVLESMAHQLLQIAV